MPSDLQFTLSVADYALVGGAVLMLLLIGWLTGRNERTTRDFFVGARKIPAWAVCLSFVATEISAMTIIGVPGRAYAENWHYLQFFVGSVCAKLFVAFLFLPAFYKFECVSIYEFLKHRFGPSAQYTGATLFFFTRFLASAVRLYVACMAVALIFWPTNDPAQKDAALLVALAGFTLVSIAFIAFGGIKAVVWTGVFSAIVFFAAGAGVIIWLWPQINGGFREIYSTASEAGRLALFDWTLDFSKDKTFWGASFNAFFIGLAVFGTDQELVQRLLTAEKRKSAQKALLGTIAAALPLLVLYLGIGTLLFVYFQQNPTLPTPAKGDEILPYFTAHILPVGMKGLVLAAVILASIDSPLASLASSFVTDIYRPLIRSAGTETHYLWVSRLCVGIFGVGLACAAFAFRQTDAILWVGFQVFSITGGATLGAFLLGILTRRPRAMDVVAGMLISTEVCAFLMYCLKAELIALGWTWVIVIGTGLTIVIGLMSSALEKPHQGSRAG